MSFNYSKFQDEHINEIQQPQQPQQYYQQTQMYNYQPQVEVQSQQPQYVDTQSNNNFQQSNENLYVQQSFNSQPVNPMNPQQTNIAKPESSKALTVFIFNLLLPGLGHVVLGQYNKGLFLMSFWFVSLIVVCVLIPLTLGIFGLFIPVLGFIWIFAIVDGQILIDKFEKGGAIFQEVRMTKEQKLYIEEYNKQHGI